MTLAEKVGTARTAAVKVHALVTFNGHADTSMLAQVVYGHLDDPQGQDIQRGVSYLKLRPGITSLATPCHAMLGNACSHQD